MVLLLVAVLGAADRNRLPKFHPGTDAIDRGRVGHSQCSNRSQFCNVPAARVQTAEQAQPTPPIIRAEPGPPRNAGEDAAVKIRRPR
jgi:hypothetical protein